MCALANDKLLPSCISTIFGNGGSCRLAVVLTALFVSFWSTVPRQTVCRLLPLNICLRLTCQVLYELPRYFLIKNNTLGNSGLQKLLYARTGRVEWCTNLRSNSK